MGKHAKEGCPTGRRRRPELSWVVTESETKREATQSESEKEGTDQSNLPNFTEDTESKWELQYVAGDERCSETDTELLYVSDNELDCRNKALKPSGH